MNSTEDPQEDTRTDSHTERLSARQYIDTLFREFGINKGEAPLAVYSVVTDKNHAAYTARIQAAMDAMAADNKETSLNPSDERTLKLLRRKS